MFSRFYRRNASTDYGRLPLYIPRACLDAPGGDSGRSCRITLRSDEQEVRRFLHLLCCQVELAGESIFDSGNHPTLDLELCCQSYVTQSVAIALYLDFLQRRYPAFLVRRETHRHPISWQAELFAPVNSEEDRGPPTRHAGHSRSCKSDAFRLVSSEVVHQISEFTVWLSDIAETWGAHPTNQLQRNMTRQASSIARHGFGSRNRCSGEREASIPSTVSARRTCRTSATVS